MYKILKDKGSNKNVILENTETSASVVIGRLSMTIIEILTKQEHMSFGTEEGSTKLTDNWGFEVSSDTAKELQKLALKIEKPIRKKAESTPDKNMNKTIDALDVLLGKANYV